MDPQEFIAAFVEALDDAGVVYEEREAIYHRLLRRLEQNLDADDLLEISSDCHYHDDALDAVIRERHPDWFSEERAAVEE